jgi:peptide/nickel transport system substrate-binding protein
VAENSPSAGTWDFARRDEGSCRLARSAAAVVVAGGMLAALGVLGSSPVAAQGRAGRLAASTGATFVVGNTSSVQKLDPDVVTNFLDFQALGLIYNQLVQYNSKLEIVPQLASKWTFSNAGKTLTFTLRRGVKFDDGSTMTSADVVASLERAINPKTADASASFLAAVTKITAPSAATVTLTLRHPDSSILSGLTSVNLSIMPAAAIKAGTIAKKPDGTGPYMFSSWSPGNSFTMVANPYWWGGRPTLSTIEIKTVPNEQSIASAVEAGTVQLGMLTQPQIATHLPSSVRVQKVLDLTYRALMLQDRSGPLANKDNRLAIACATNRQQILNDAVFGAGKVVGPVPIGIYASNPVSAVCPTPDLAKAKAYLRAAGDPQGFSFTALTSTELDPTSSAQATAMQSELAQAGITMHIENLAGNAYIQDWLKGKFQAAFAWNGADPDPYTMYGRYFGAGANLGVPAGYSSPTLQHLLLAGDTASTVAQKEPIWKQLSDYLTSNAVWIWLFTAYDYAATPPNVHGFTLGPTNSTSLYGLATTKVS